MIAEVAGWLAPFFTTVAAIMVAANLGSRITGFGFIVFAAGSIAWLVVGIATGQDNLSFQNAVLFIINIIGVWRWLAVRARYERGAARATRVSAGRSR
ncbi:MAG: hypothetical protein DCF31_02135 [Alphaproteobacteria bacterium]|nr:MAG: hypothetical protein DCF31_02135 [Alphaproteobacteria bacterium]